MREELRPSPTVRVHQEPPEVGGARWVAGLDGAVDCRGQQRQGRDPLLAVDEGELSAAASPVSAVARIEPMKCVCPSSASATQWMSSSSREHRSTSHL